jgi:hypothetical protein
MRQLLELIRSLGWLGAIGLGVVVALGLLLARQFVLLALLAGGAGLAFWLWRRVLAAGARLPPPAAAGSMRGLVVDLALDAKVNIGRLRSLAVTCGDPIMGRKLDSLADEADRMIELMLRRQQLDPETRRLVSYYLPRIADVVEGAVNLPRRRADVRAKVRATVLHAHDAFVSWRTTGKQWFTTELEVELDLLKRAIRDDGAPPASPPPA